MLREASRREFDPQTWNCALFVRACAEALTGRPIPKKLYRTLERTVDAYFQRIERTQARRGDIVLAEIPQRTLGVCTGARAAFVSPSGLTEIPMSHVLIVWRAE